jgi:hypothetical protein
MKYYILMLIILLAAGLCAEINMYPRTTLAEACVTTSEPNCQMAYNGLNSLLGDTNRSEFITARLYHDSGTYSNASVESRYAFYGVMAVPTVVFNGITSIVGPATEQSYWDILSPNIFGGSPIQIRINDFNTTTGIVSGTVTMYDPLLTIEDEPLTFMLLEDNVGTETNVVRQVTNSALFLAGQGNSANYSYQFNLDPGWNPANLWAIVLFQRQDHEIIQATSSLSLPVHSMRCAFDWDANDVVGDVSATLLGEPLYFFNMGGDDDMMINLVVDNGPTDWYFNYCDDIGNCYPGGMQLPFNLTAGEARNLHLNIWIGSTGIAHAHFEITSPALGTFNVFFTVRSSDYVGVCDEVVAAPLTLKGNAPNPFRGQTSFAVTADKAQSASVQVFNLRGQIVAETASQSLGAGENNIVWQAPTDLPAGIYFYRLKGVQSSLQRMLLLK